MNTFLLHQRSRRGTLLIYVLTVMSIVTVMVSVLVNTSVLPGNVASTLELRAQAEAMALSGFDITTTLAQEITPTFLHQRLRVIPTTEPYAISKVFGLPEGPAPSSMALMPPVEYPPLKDIALGYPPTNDADISPAVYDNDIRLPSNQTIALLPAGKYISVPGAAYGAEFAVLPASNFQPLNSDPVNYPTVEVAAGTNGRIITALQPSELANPATPLIGWWGPVNDASAPLTYAPPDAIVQGSSTTKKFPPPSVILTRDLSSADPRILKRAFIYIYYLRSSSIGNRMYYMTSARIRQVYVDTTSELGPELMVSSTQLR